jgi:hypothetical protein
MTRVALQSGGLEGDYQIGITERGQRTRRYVAVRLDGPPNLPSLTLDRFHVHAY